MNKNINLIGKNAKFLQLLALIKKIAPTDVSVCISGESGTGKELVAQRIHNTSGLRGPFVPVNCGAIPKDLIEGLMFGHERGSFTGATERQLGFFEQAHQGTLFLDEIAEMPLDVQVKLLRVIESSRLKRLGAKSELSVRVRIVTATHQNLQKLVQQNKFREDLFYRLYVLPIHIEPLRNRQEDIPLLAKHFLQQLDKSASLSIEALNKLQAYSWPGNVRELKNTIHRSLLLAENKILHINDIKLISSNGCTNAGTLVEIERNTIQQTMEQFTGNKSQMAKSLGIARSTLAARLKKHGLDCKTPSKTSI
jgi:DNA-binding NtrC family response regulator